MTYLSKLAYDAGIPRSKNFVHATCYGTYEDDLAALVNPYANPGVTWYPTDNVTSAMSDTNLINAVHTAEAQYGATGYCYGEWALSDGSGTYYPWLTKSLIGDPDCIYQSLYNAGGVYCYPSIAADIRAAMATYPVPEPSAFVMLSCAGNLPAGLRPEEAKVSL